MRIAHISDLHIIAQPGNPGLVRDDSVSRARGLIADIMAFRPAIDLVVITGDNVNDARPEEYEVLRDVLAGLTLPFVIIPGNHDDRTGLRDVAPLADYPATGFLFHEHRQGGLRLFALDSLSEGRIGGALDEAQLDWLEAGLAQPFPGQTMVALHHPPVPPSMGLLDRNILTVGAERLAQILHAFGQPVVTLCGHMHRPFTAVLGNVTISAATSTAFQFRLSLDDLEEPDAPDEPFHYGIHVLESGGSHVIHRRFVRF